jgi:D-glycero-D-manno-heptose 1,7-bisphosphate phosphatase
MLVAATAHWGIDLSRSAMVGDRWRDVDAGVAAGCRTVFVDHGYDEPLRARPDHTVASLLEAVPWLVDHAGTAR